MALTWGDAWRAVLAGPPGPDGAVDPEVQRRMRQGTATYRSGRVSDVRLEIGRVSARVQGSRATPFLVEVEVGVLDDDGWDVVLDLMAETVRHSARLLAGQHPEGLLQEAAARGAHLLPRREDVAVAAGHGGEEPFPVVGAAVWEAVASRIDASPFPLLQLRGRGRERVLREVGRRRRAGDDSQAAGVPAADVDVLGWSTESAPLEAIGIPPARVPRIAAPGLQVLGEPDGWAGALSPAELLAPLVAGAGEAALDLLAGPDPDEEPDRQA